MTQYQQFDVSPNSTGQWQNLRFRLINCWINSKADALHEIVKRYGTDRKW